MNILKLLGVKSWVFPIIFFEHLDRGDKVKNLIREFIFYSICLFAVTISTLAHAASFYWYDLIMDELIGDKMEFLQNGPIEKPMSELANLEQMWTAIEHLLTSSYLWEYWYKYPPENDKKKYIHSFLLGPPRIRQVRVKNDSCEVYEDFEKYFKYCYSFYNYKTKDTKPFGKTTSLPESAWKYSYPIDIGGMTFEGTVADYDAGGYYVDLSYNRPESLKLIKYLKQNLWVDRQTSAVFLDINLYNHNINSFICLKVAFELPPTGGVMFSTKVTNNKLLLYKFKHDYFVFACDFLFMAYNTYYILNISYGFEKYGIEFMYNKWVILELFLISLGFILKFARAGINFFSQRLFEKFKHADGVFINFEVLGYMNQHYANMAGLFFFLSWIKMFKFLGFSGVLGQLNTAIQKSVTPIFGFFIIFMIFFFAYAILGYLLFGGDAPSFRTIGTAMFTLFCSIQEMFNYKEIPQDFYGTLYLVAYVSMIGFIMLNMFLAIINSSYTTVRNEILVEEPVSEFLIVLKRGAQRVSQRFPPRLQKYFKFEKPLEEFNFIKTILRLAKYEKKEINLFFVKYLVERDITDKDAKEFIKEVHEHGYEMPESAEYIQNRDDFEQYITPRQFLNQNIQLEALERNVKKLHYNLILFAHYKNRVIQE